MTHYGEENGCDCSKLKRIRERVEDLRIEPSEKNMLVYQVEIENYNEAIDDVLAIIDEEGK